MRFALYFLTSMAAGLVAWAALLTLVLWYERRPRGGALPPHKPRPDEIMCQLITPEEAGEMGLHEWGNPDGQTED